LIVVSGYAVASSSAGEATQSIRGQVRECIEIARTAGQNLDQATAVVVGVSPQPCESPSDPSCIRDELLFLLQLLRVLRDDTSKLVASLESP
jgi:hypothetical protein